jgi:phosphoribosylaminoimidazole (AIR) synthetase
MKIKSKDLQQVINFGVGTTLVSEQKSTKTIQFYTKENVNRQIITRNIIRDTKSF